MNLLAGKNEKEHEVNHHFVILPVIVIVIPSALWATEYYATPDRANNNLKTTPESVKTIEHGIRRLKGGDTLYLRGGHYHETVNIRSLHGSEDQPITIMAVPGETVILDGSIPINTKWNRYKGQIYRTRLERPVWQLFVEGKSMSSARWPNGNWNDDSLWDSSQSMAWPEKERSHFGHHYNRGLQELDFTLEGAIIIVTSGSFRTFKSRVIEHEAGSDNFIYDLNGVQQHSRGFSVDRHSYFLEGKLGLLDTEGEWFYSLPDRMLYLWPPDGRHPESLDIRGKVQSYALDVSESSHLMIKGVQFFGTTFRFEDSHHVVIEDCHLLYPSYSRRMLGDLGQMDVTMMVVDGEFTPAYNTVRNCVIEYADGPALEMNGLGNLIENCHMHDIDYSCTYKGGYTLNMIDAAELTFRRNTVHTTGASELFKAGVRNLIELNDLSHSGCFQNDGSMIQVSVKQQNGNVTRYNWLHDSVKQGFRFDNSNKPNSPWGEGGRAHHNVTWKVSRQFIKGDKHFIHNNLCFDCEKNDLSISSKIEIQGRNFSTVTRNNIAGMLSGDIRRSLKDYPLPGIAGNNWSGVEVKRDVRTQLRDPDNLDFRPRKDSELVDAGSTEVGIELDYQGKAPDIGPYEYGAKDYWIPGRQLKRASRPVPPNGSITVKADADLMWLSGLKAVRHRIFFGASTDDLKFKLEQENNIFNPGPLKPGVTYFWRIDAVTKAGVLKGNIWRFTVFAD